MKQAIHFTEMSKSYNEDELVQFLRTIFSVNRFGKPVVTNNHVLYEAYQLLRDLPLHIKEEILYTRFYKDNEKRYKELIAKWMIELPGGTFNMGNHKEAEYLYCGEEPLHEVYLSPYKMMSIPVSTSLYKEFDPDYQDAPQNYPATSITWYDSFMFAIWCNTDLPTEAEWEYAAKGGKNHHYPTDEHSLIDYAWFSDNSGGKLHVIGQKKQNNYGLYDINGNVWEWCLDTYNSNYYSKTASHNPVNINDGENRVCRGGSFHSFIDMCRNNFRHHEPASFHAYDLGFRLVKHEGGQIQ
ncbi:formylglycine-generating enzyme family protein [Paenibacillus sp. FSL R5-0341]|uniref:formylglycine-generating enzyme family protein n=1 Tax=Paenibacillus sp. FSL R5-0341 TaxID=2921636 RepID=UPI0030CC7B27